MYICDMSREKLEAAGWYKKESDGDYVHWYHERFQHEPMTYEEAHANLPSEDIPEGMMDWNNQPMDFYAEVLENRYRFDSSGEAKAAMELVRFYRANKDRDPNRTENAQLYRIEDHWERLNVETRRVIAEGTNMVNGLFTMVEVNEWLKSHPLNEDIPEFKQVRNHNIEVIPVNNEPLI